MYATTRTMDAPSYRDGTDYGDCAGTVVLAGLPHAECYDPTSSLVVCADLSERQLTEILGLYEEWAIEDGRVYDRDAAARQLVTYAAQGRLVPITLEDYEGNVFGCVLVLVFPDPFNAGKLIAAGDQMFVSPSLRGKGAATKLVEAAEQLAQWMGATTFRVPSKLAMQPFYEKVLPAGYHVDAVVYVKEI